MFMTSKDIIEKDDKAYNLFSNKPPKDILAILNLQEDDVANNSNTTPNDSKNYFKNFSLKKRT